MSLNKRHRNVTNTPNKTKFQAARDDYPHAWLRQKIENCVLGRVSTIIGPDGNSVLSVVGWW